MSDLFGEAGMKLLDHLQLGAAFAARVNSLRRLLDPLDAWIALFGGMAQARLARHPGIQAIQAIDGLGPVLAWVLVAELGDVSRFPGPAQLASWVGLTPKHHESDPHPHVHRGPITTQGSRPPRWAAIEAVQRIGPQTRLGRIRERVACRRGRNIGVVAAARERIELVSDGLRDGHLRRLAAGTAPKQRSARVVQVMTPKPAWSPRLSPRLIDPDRPSVSNRSMPCPMPCTAKR